MRDSEVEAGYIEAFKDADHLSKGYTSMIPMILDNNIWAGVLKGLDVQLVTIE